MVKLRNLKGTKDYDVPEKLIQNQLISIIRDAYEKFGFNPLETPIIEFSDILSSKYAGGAEILKEMYTLKDNGDRELALRYDLTVPFCRYVGIKGERELKMPFKRYEIGKVFRDGPTKLGRLREFYQCDADVVGSTNLIYDSECLAIMCHVFSQLDREYFIEINNRKILIGIIQESGIQSEELASSIILSIDKLKKIGKEGVEDELIEKGIGPSTFEPLFKHFSIQGNNEELLEYYDSNLTNETARKGLEELKLVLTYCKQMGIEDRIVFRPELARGLEIYTGTIFEAFFKNSKITSSIGAGGRYDKIIGKFLNQKKVIPSVGFTIGLDVILSDIMDDPESYPSLMQRKTSVEVLIIPIKVDLGELLPFITQLRKSGFNCEFYTKKKKGIKGGLGLADYLAIPITVILGKKELDENQITLRDMKNQEQHTVSLEEAVQKITQILSSK